MSNLDKAEELLSQFDWPCSCPVEQIVSTLADAGLIAPELPESVRAWIDDNAPLIWHVPERPDRLAVTLDERPTHPTIGLEDDNRVLKHLTATEARALGLALLAAAQHAKGKA